MSNEEMVIEVGQWLGTHNRISKMERFPYGWRATDSLGTTYRQTAFTNGLYVGEHPNTIDREKRTPWPKEEE